MEPKFGQFPSCPRKICLFLNQVVSLLASCRPMAMGGIPARPRSCFGSSRSPKSCTTRPTLWRRSRAFCQFSLLDLAPLTPDSLDLKLFGKTGLVVNTRSGLTHSQLSGLQTLWEDRFGGNKVRTCLGPISGSESGNMLVAGRGPLRCAPPHHAAERAVELLAGLLAHAGRAREAVM